MVTTNGVIGKSFWFKKQHFNLNLSIRNVMKIPTPQKKSNNWESHALLDNLH